MGRAAYCRHVFSYNSYRYGALGKACLQRDFKTELAYTGTQFRNNYGEHFSSNRNYILFYLINKYSCQKNVATPTEMIFKRKRRSFTSNYVGVSTRI